MGSLKWAVRLGGIVFGATALIGLLHLPIARTMLAQIGGCPFAGATPEEVERAQDRAFHALRGSTPARQRPAMGFALETTTLQEIEAWTRAHGLSCESSQRDTLVTCERVPAGALMPGTTGRFDQLAFGFRLADHRLINVSSLTIGLEPGAAAGLLASAASRLEAALGAPTNKRLPPADWDAQGPAYVAYRYSDYLADVSAMNLPGRGVALREQYLSMREEAGKQSTN